MKTAISIVAVVALVAGICGLAYSRWTAPIAAGDAALAAGQLDRALSSYSTAQARFDGLPAVRQMFPSDYNRVVSNELWALYRLGRYDDTIDRAEHAPEEAFPHFWSGCAFFQKASAEEKPEARLNWLTRAEEELRKAVEASPDDWDTKYDFELTSRLAAEMRKQPKNPPKQLLQLLRPPQPQGRPTKKVG